MTSQKRPNQPKQMISQSICINIFSALNFPKEMFIYSKRGILPMSLERRGFIDRKNCTNFKFKNVPCKDNNLFEKVQIPPSHLNFPQYNTAVVNKNGELSITCRIIQPTYVTLFRANAVNYLCLLASSTHQWNNGVCVFLRIHSCIIVLVKSMGAFFITILA